MNPDPDARDATTLADTEPAASSAAQPRFRWRTIPWFALFVLGTYLLLTGVGATSVVAYRAAHNVQIGLTAADPTANEWAGRLLLTFATLAVSGVLMHVSAYHFGGGRWRRSAIAAAWAFALLAFVFWSHPGAVPL